MSLGNQKDKPLLPIPGKAPSAGSFSPCQGFPECQGGPSPKTAKTHPEHVGKADLRVAVSNVVLSVLGAGQLTLPYALSQLGLTFGLVCLVVFALLSVYSCRTLSVHAVALQKTPRCCLLSYSEMIVLAVGRAGEQICSSMIAIYSWGGGVGFLMILKGELAYLAQGVFGLPETVFDLDTGILLMLLVTGCVIWPLSSLYDISSLKVFAPLACGAALSITAVVAACTPWGEEPCRGPAGAVPGSVAAPGSLKQVPDSLADVAAALPLLAFALNSSWAYVPIFCTLKDKSDARIWSLIGGSNIIILLSYMVLSSCGYFMFCGDTEPNILESMGQSVHPDSVKGTAVRLARAALAFQLSIGLPGRFWVARRTLGGGELPLLPRCCMSGALAGSAAVLAALPLSLATVLGVVSSVCASMIIYILPAVIDLANKSVPGAGRRACSVLSLLVGLFVMCFGLWANVAGVAKGS